MHSIAAGPEVWVRYQSTVCDSRLGTDPQTRGGALNATAHEPHRSRGSNRTRHGSAQREPQPHSDVTP